MTKFDKFIHSELQSRLQPDETITTTGFLFKTRMGLLSLKMNNDGVVEIPYADVKSIEQGGFLNQKTLTITLTDGTALKYRLNTFARSTSGQKQFFSMLNEHHSKSTKMG